MRGVHFASHTNSTKFTNCCNTAICDYEKKCPKCGEEIEGDPQQRHDMAMLKLYGSARLQKLREGYSK